MRILIVVFFVILPSVSLASQQSETVATAAADEGVESDKTARSADGQIEQTAEDTKAGTTDGDASNASDEKSWWESESFKNQPKKLSPCAHVTCSYRGQCVVIENVPTCACSQGYVTEPNNPLACVSLQNIRQRRYRENSYATQNAIPHESLEDVLGGYDLRPARKDYQKENTRESFPQFLKKRFKRNKLGGMGAIGSGIISMLGSIALYVPGFAYDNEALVGIGTAVELVGVVFLIAGIVTVVKANKRLERLKRYRRRYWGRYLPQLSPILFSNSNDDSDIGLMLGVQF